MESKFIIFVVLTNLVLCSFAQPADINYGLTDEELTVLDQIISTQNAALTTKLGAVNPLSDAVEKYASILIYNLAAVVNDDEEVVADATAQANLAHDYAIDSIEIALGKSCDTLEEARAIIHATEVEAYQTSAAGLTLATSGNYSDNRAQMEAYRDTLLDLLRYSIQTYYDIISTCLETTDDQILDVIEIGRSRSRLAFDQTTYSIFNGITIYADAVTAGSADISLITKLEEYRENLLDSIRADEASKFGTLRAVYIYSQLNLPASALKNLFENQYAQIVSTIKYQQEVGAIFDSVTAYATGLNLGLSDSGEADFSPIDAAQAYTLAKLNAGNDVVLNEIETVNPDTTNAVEATRETFSTSGPNVVAYIFDAIRAGSTAGINYAKSIRQIRNYKQSVIPYVDVYFGTYLDLIRNNQIFGRRTKAQLRTIASVADDRLTAFANNIFEGIGTLANIFNKGEATEDDFAEIQNYQALVDAALVDYTQATSAADVVVLKATLD